MDARAEGQSLPMLHLSILPGAFFAQDGFHLFGGSVHIYNATAGTGGGQKW